MEGSEGDNQHKEEKGQTHTSREGRGPSIPPLGSCCEELGGQPWHGETLDESRTWEHMYASMYVHMYVCVCTYSYRYVYIYKSANVDIHQEREIAYMRTKVFSI